MTSRAARKILSNPVTLTVNGRPVQVEMGATVLDAVRAAGSRIPTLCYHPEFKARAVCRMCLVDMEGERRPQPACHTLAEEGAIVNTDTDELKAFRKVDLQFLLARHPNECIRCEVAGNCKLQDLVEEYQVEDLMPKMQRGSLEHPEHRIHDHTSPSIWRDMDKCIECGLCVDSCSAQKIDAIGFVERGKGMVPVPTFDKPLCQTGCISCGQCTLVCPVGALIERPDWQRVLEVLSSKRRTTVVQTAPATRVSIGEEFGFEPGTISTGRMIQALRALGFDYVFDTGFSADLTIMEEANELLARLRGEREGKLPLFTSCCPGWINYIEIHRPDLLPHLSTTKSPQQMHAAVIKRGPFGRNAIPESEEPFVVSIMPCTAKKDEADRPGMRGDVDAVLTTRELAKLIRHCKIPFASLSNDDSYDSPLGESTGAAAIFGASGGVLEAALRTAVHALGIEDAPIEFKECRGIDRGVKVATIPGVGSVAAVSSIASAIDLLSNDSWKDDYLMIEVMACPGGCLGGGGEPKSDDPNILEKRAKSIYQIDADATLRNSHDNPEVQQLYKDMLDHPLSEKSEQLLHTVYSARGSPREKLFQFLDAVDHRDGTRAADLFTKNGVWNTNTPLYGEIYGKENIKSLIESKLPALPPYSAGHARLKHRFVSNVEGTNIVAPDGQNIHFDVALDDATGRIKSLKRIPGESTTTA